MAKPTGSAQGWRWQRGLVVLLLTVAIWLLWQTQAIAFPQTFFIDQARHQPDGASVVVAGNVTVPCGLFASANADQGFAIQDVTGGIYVSSARELPIQLGDTVAVTGTLQDDGHGQRWLKLQQWQHSDRPLLPIAPQVTSTRRAGKHLDGQLVTVQGAVSQPLQDDTPYGDRLWIADDTGEIQIYVAKSTHIDPAELGFLTVGQTIAVTGLSSQYDEHDEIMPRTRADIRVLN